MYIYLSKHPSISPCLLISSIHLTHLISYSQAIPQPFEVPEQAKSCTKLLHVIKRPNKNLPSP